MENEKSFGISDILVRLIVGSIILAVTAALTPGFTIAGFWPLIIGAAVLSLIDFGVAKITGIDAKPYGRGIVGFLLAALVIYSTQFFVAGFSVTIIGAIIGALVYGIVDAIVPGMGM